MIYSRLHCCVLVWGTTSKGNLERLHIMQKKAIRFIENLSAREHTQGFFYENKILTFTNVFRQVLALRIYNEIKRDQPGFFATYERAHCGYELRNVLFTSNLIRTSYGKQSVDFQIPALLNMFQEIVQIVCNSNSVNSFKRQVKTFLLDKA